MNVVDEIKELQDAQLQLICVMKVIRKHTEHRVEASVTLETIHGLLHVFGVKATALEKH